jgi:four helix bundle protein
MALEVESVALELVAELLARAANSVVLNICEAAYSDAGNRRARFHSAAGSANEVRGALKLAKAWEHVSAKQTRAADELLDRVMAMLWKLKR